MAQHVFRADPFKWMVRNIKILLFYGVLAAGFWLAYNHSHDVYFLVFAVLMIIGGVVTFVTGLFTKPRLSVSDEELKLGRVDFKFADVVDVKHHKDDYTFFLASRRRMSVKLSEFSDKDKKEIDKILAQNCMKYLSAGDAKEKIAKSAETAGLEFSYQAKRTSVFFAFFLMIMIFGGISVMICLIILFSGNGADAGTPVALTLIISLCLGVIAWLIEKRAAKDVFSFRDDTFTLLHKDKVKFSFAREDVQGVGINPQGQAYIIFRLKNKKKRLKLPLVPFSRRDSKEMKSKIRSIFFLPDPKKQNPLQNPFKF